MSIPLDETIPAILLPNEVIKCVVVGDTGVGKTRLLRSYINSPLQGESFSTVFNHYSVAVMIKGRSVNLGLRDTSGQSDHDRVRRLSYNETNVFLICFSIVDPDSFKNVKSVWYPEISRYSPDTPILLVGTKKDLRDDREILKGYFHFSPIIFRLQKRQLNPISYLQGAIMKREIGAIAYIECSAVTREGLQVFDEAVRIGLWPYQRSKKMCVIQ